MIALEFTSTLPITPERAWQHASSFAGVNAELWPIHMHGVSALRFDQHTPMDTVLARSLLTLFKVFPFDVHSFMLAEVWPGRGFREASHSWLQHSWVHERTIEPDAPGCCVVRDRLSFAPRFVPTLTARAVELVFKRRHSRLHFLFPGL